MISAAAVKATEITFKTQKGGYDRQQVDRYIEKLTLAYTEAYDEYSIICAKYSKLLERYAQLEQQSRSMNLNAKAITKSLVDAEVMAGKIVAGAREEASVIKADAVREARKITGDAYIEKAAASRSVEAANEFLAQTVSKLQGMVAG